MASQWAAIWLLAALLATGCAGGGGAPGKSAPVLPTELDEVSVVELASGGSAHSPLGESPSAAPPPADLDSLSNANNSKKLDVLISEIAAMRKSYGSLEPAINRFVRVEEDITQIIQEMELLLEEPAPLDVPEDVFPTGRQPPERAPPVASPAPLAPPAPLTPQDAEPPPEPPPPKPEGVLSGVMASAPAGLTLKDETFGPPTPSGDAPLRIPGTEAPAPTAQPSPLAPPGGAPLELSDAARRELAPDPAPKPAASPPPRPTPSRSAAPRSRASSGAGEYVEHRPHGECAAYDLHLGSFLKPSSLDNVRAQMASLGADLVEGLEYTVTPIDLNDGRGVFQRFTAGRVDDFERANTLCIELLIRGQFCRIILKKRPSCELTN